MKFEPAFDRRLLLARARDAYGIPVRDLRFVPVGFAACYVLTACDDNGYFLKVWTAASRAA